MHERVRMLGGQTQIESSPGGPTVISAVLPRFGHDGRLSRAGAQTIPCWSAKRTAPARLGTPSLR